MKLEIFEPSTPDAGPILVCDEAMNDIAEFYHDGHATVGQTYETALMLARKLVEASAEPICETCNGDGEIDQRLGGIATSSVVACPDCADGRAPQSTTVAQAVQVRNETIEECARITTAPFGLAYTSQRHKEVAKDVADQIGRAIRALAAQPPAAPVEANQAFETYRETVKNVAAAREKGYAAARENLKEAWSAIAMIREAVETLAPSGSVKAAEHLDGPTFTHEADALVAGIMSLAAHNGCSADCETEIKCTDCGVTGFDEHKPGCRGIRQQQYVPSAELRAATEQQPVYYRYRTKLHGGDWMVVRPDDLPKDKSGWEIEPLYRAVPQPAAVPDLDTAWQWDGKELLHDTPDWVAENTEQTWSSLSLAGFTGGITAFTSFGKARLKKGDWLVRHEGEIHAVKDAVYSALSRPESK